MTNPSRIIGCIPTTRRALYLASSTQSLTLGVSALNDVPRRVAARTLPL